MREFLTAILEKIGKATWLAIETDHPRCTYYFGPYLNHEEAAAAQEGFLEDLKAEGATILRVDIEVRPTPKHLTVEAETVEGASRSR